MRIALSLVTLLVLCSTVVLAGPILTNENENGTPQIVRVSYVQGEVKLSPGVRGMPVLGKDWIAADVNAPIEQGTTLATENGRAEVEFENGSVAYLAEHSVLQFDQLTGDSQKTSTAVALLTGRATFAQESNGRDEITIHAGKVTFRTTQAVTMRVESALDGTIFRMAAGSMELTQKVTGSQFPLRAGEAVQYLGGVLSRVVSPTDDPDQKAWDHWVSEEKTARKADIEKGLKESGLAAPIPGLVDLVRQGTFTECPPYGMCWEPNEGAATDSMLQEKSAEPARQGVEADKKGQLAGGGTQSPQPGGNPASAASQPGARYAWVSYSYSGCPYVYSGRKLMKYTKDHSKGIVVSDQADWPTQTLLQGSGWWATCYSGSWARPPREARRPGPLVARSNGTIVVRGFPSPGRKPCIGVGCPPRPRPKKWVVGPKSNGGSFWRVSMGGKVGFIPKHPLDVKGMRPLHSKDGVLMFHEKDGQQVVKIKSAPEDLRVEENLPAGYESKWAKDLPKVEKPLIEGRLMSMGNASSGAIAKLTGTGKGQPIIRYDYKTRDFVAPANVVGGARGNERTGVLAHLGLGRGSEGSGGSQHYGGWSGGGSSQSSSRGYSGSGGSGSSRGSSSGGGSTSRASSGGGSGNGSSHGSSSGSGSSSHESYGGGGSGSSYGSSSGGGSVSNTYSGGGGGGGSQSSPPPSAGSGRPH